MKLDLHDDLDTYLMRYLLSKDDGLWKEVWRCLLLKGKAADLKRESRKRILEELQEAENIPLRHRFGQHYLNVLKSRPEWDESILEYILDLYGSPRETGGAANVDTRFWEKVSPGAKSEYRKWLLLRQIEIFFEGERADFWRDFVESGTIADVKEILEGEGFMLDFQSFGVIEFKNVGNAAYVYPIKPFNDYWMGASAHRDHVGYFKDKDKTMKMASGNGAGGRTINVGGRQIFVNRLASSSWDGRIIHHGSWQINTKAMIGGLLKQNETL